MATYPRITADLQKIKHNVDMLCALCAENGVSIAAVTKVVCADERIARVLDDSKATMLADARAENLMPSVHCKCPPDSSVTRLMMA